MLTPVTLPPAVSPFGLHRHQDPVAALADVHERDSSTDVLPQNGNLGIPFARLADHPGNSKVAPSDTNTESKSPRCPQSPTIPHTSTVVPATEGESEELLEAVRASLFDAPVSKNSGHSLSAKKRLHHVGKASTTHNTIHNNQGSSSDTDISEISECDCSANEASDSCSIGSRNVDNNNNHHQHSSPKTKNIFYICNSPSPTNANGFTRNQRSNLLHESHLMESDTCLGATSSGGSGPERRQKSLFDNPALALDLTTTSSTRLSRSRQHSLTREYTQDVSSSSTEISEDEDYFSEEVDSNRVISHSNGRRSPSHAPSSAILQDDDWVSLSSGDESNSEGVGSQSHTRDGLDFANKSTRQSKNASFAQPRLNELCLDSRSQKRNSLPTIIKTKSLLSTMMSSSLQDESLPRQEGKVKDASPQLRRSCTSDTMRLPLYREQSLAGLRQPSLAGQCERLECFDFKSGHQASCLNLCDLNKSGSLSVKQKSSVGLSNFKVIARSSSATINSIEPNPQPIRDLVSKSAINLTKLYRTSVSKLSNLADYEGKQLDSDPLKIRQRFAPLNWSIQTQHSEDLLADSLAPFHAGPSSVSSPDFDHSASPCFVDERWLSNQTTLRADANEIPLQKVVNTVIMSNHKTVAILASELSKSLRDSIDKDHKLGKIPMPDRVVFSEAIPDIDMNANDYHSTGW